MKTILDIATVFLITYIILLAYKYIIEPELKNKIQKEILESGIMSLIGAKELKQQVIRELRSEGYIIKLKKINS